MIRFCGTARASPWIVLGLILLLAAALRCWRLGAQSLWVDEIFSLQCMFGHNYEILKLPRNAPIWPVPTYTDPQQALHWWLVPLRLNRDLHSPVPYLSLRAWCGLFGYTEVAVRSLALISSLACIVLLFLIARMLHGTGPALWAGLLMAVAQPQIEFAQEARQYAMLTAIALLGCLVLLRAINYGATLRRCVTLSVLALAIILTHYYAAAVVAAMGLYVVIRVRGAPRRRLLLALGAGCVAFAVLWGPVVLQQQGNVGSAANFLSEQPSGHLRRTLERAAQVPPRLLSEMLPGTMGRGGPSWESVAAFSGAMICLLPWLMLRGRKDLLLWAIWVPAVILPPLLMDLRSGTWGLVLLRWTLVAAPGVYCIIAALSWQARRPWMRHALPLIAVISCLLSVPAAYEPSKHDWRAIGGYLASHATQGDATVFASNDDPKHNPNFWFLGTFHYAGPARGPVFLVDRPADSPLLNRLRGYRHVWLITDSTDPQAVLPGATFVDHRSFLLGGGIMSIGLVDMATSAGE